MSWYEATLGHSGSPSTRENNPWPKPLNPEVEPSCFAKCNAREHTMQQWPRLKTNPRDRKSERQEREEKAKQLPGGLCVFCLRTPLSLCTPKLNLYGQVITWACMFVRGFSPVCPVRTRGRQDITRSRQSRQEPTGIEGLLGYQPTRMQTLTGCLFRKLVRKLLPTPTSTSSAAGLVVVAAAIFSLLSGPSSQAIARFLTSQLACGFML